MENVKVCHIEYKSEDLDLSQRFCQALFGWQFEAFGDDMVVFRGPDGHIGGFVAGRPGASMNPEVCYAVEAIDDTVEKAVALGGRIGAEKRAVPSVGWYASVFGPDGNEFGLVQFSPRDQ